MYMTFHATDPNSLAVRARMKNGCSFHYQWKLYLGDRSAESISSLLPGPLAATVHATSVWGNKSQQDYSAKPGEGSGSWGISCGEVI